MDIVDEAHDIFTASSVICDNIDSHIDAIISSAFVAPDEVLHGECSMNDDAGFAQALR